MIVHRLRHDFATLCGAAICPCTCGTCTKTVGWTTHDKETNCPDCHRIMKERAAIVAKGYVCPHCSANLMETGLIHGYYCNACKSALSPDLADLTNKAMDAAGVPFTYYPEPRVPKEVGV